MENICSVCNRYPDRNPSFVGVLTVINMTPWESKQGREFCYGRELYVAKLGGKDKPGVLKKLERMKKEYNGLVGKVFEVFRAGRKTESVGDEFKLVDTIPEGELVARGKQALSEWAKHINKRIDDPEKFISLDKLWERAPWVPFDYDEVLNVRSNEELELMFGAAGRSVGGYDQDDFDRTSSDRDDFNYDDIPF